MRTPPKVEAMMGITAAPIIPANAKVHNVTCHYCIVGCGYHAYSWDVNTEGGTAPGDNVFNADLAQQQVQRRDDRDLRKHADGERRAEDGVAHQLSLAANTAPSRRDSNEICVGRSQRCAATYPSAAAKR